MISVSNVSAGAARPLTAAERAPEAQEPEPRDRPARPPVMDEYVPEKRGEKEEKYSCNTDEVDREIEALKKARQELKLRLSAETDEVKARELERQLAQVERELERKDSDAYRRRHADCKRLS